MRATVITLHSRAAAPRLERQSRNLPASHDLYILAIIVALWCRYCRDSCEDDVNTTLNTPLDATKQRPPTRLVLC